MVLWHTLKKLPEKFGYHDNKASIFGSIYKLFYNSKFVQEFEEAWAAMSDTYGLQDNDWLSGLYQNIGHWVPYFLKTSFCVKISITQRSESIEAFLDGYVHSKILLKQFVKQYEEKEFQTDFKSFS